MDYNKVQKMKNKYFDVETKIDNLRRELYSISNEIDNYGIKHKDDIVGKFFQYESLNEYYYVSEFDFCNDIFYTRKIRVYDNGDKADISREDCDYAFFVFQCKETTKEKFMQEFKKAKDLMSIIEKEVGDINE